MDATRGEGREKRIVAIDMIREAMYEKEDSSRRTGRLEVEVGLVGTSAGVFGGKGRTCKPGFGVKLVVIRECMPAFLSRKSGHVVRLEMSILPCLWEMEGTRFGRGRGRKSSFERRPSRPMYLCRVFTLCI